MFARKHMAILLLGLLLLAGRPPAAHAAGDIDIYLALGNSLALGVEAPGNNDGQPGYPALVHSRMQDLYPGVSLVNLAVAGETSGTMISGGQLAAAESAIANAAGAGECVGFITLDIGGNDFGQILAGQTTAESAIPAFQSNLDTILNRLQAAAANQIAGCSPRIVLMDYYNPYPGLPIPPSDEPLADMYLPSLNSIIRNAAAARGIGVTNVEAAFRGREAELLYVNQDIYTNPLLRIPFTPWFETAVDFHPRSDGHEVIADQFWVAAGLTPPVPELDALPDLVQPNIGLMVPWTCGACAGGDRQQQVLQTLPEPSERNVEWLGVMIWNRGAMPIICWNLAMFQAGLNIYSDMLNTLWIPSFNEMFQLIYTMLFWLTSAFQAGWLMGEDIRLQLWNIHGAILQLNQTMGQLTVNQAAAAGGQLAEVLESWVLVFSGGLQALRYLISLYLTSVPQVLDVVINLEDHKPPQLEGLQDFWLFAALVGTLRGIYESKMGWWLVAEIALFYTATVLYLMDEVAEV